MERAPEEAAAERVLASVKGFVHALGGSTLEISGASLVTHERIPAPAFNFMVVDNVGSERQAAFFERALDHYFQRGLRPAVWTRAPVPRHLDQGLRRFGFLPGPEPVLLLEGLPPGPTEPRGPTVEVVRLGRAEIARVLPFWAEDREAEELARAFEVLAHHPNPGESLSAFVAVRAGKDVSSAVLYTDGRRAGLHGVATTLEARGLGAASALVRSALRQPETESAGRLGLVARGAGVARRLGDLGFERVGLRTEYRLPKDAALSLPSPGPPGPPRWRPPRRRPAR